MKLKLSSISLLILLLAPALITISFFQCKRLIVRHEVKKMLIEGVDKDCLVLLEFKKGEVSTEIRWEHAREFEYKGQMYDVVETVDAGNIVYYWCWWDKDETELKMQLGELGKKIFNHDPRKKERHDRIYNFYKSLFPAEKENLSLNLYPAAIKPVSAFSGLTATNAFPPPTPPPRIS